MGPDGASGNLFCAISRSRTGIGEQLASCWLVHLSWTRLLRGIQRIDRLAPWLAWLPGSMARRLNGMAPWFTGQIWVRAYTGKQP